MLAVFFFFSLRKMLEAQLIFIQRQPTIQQTKRILQLLPIHRYHYHNIAAHRILAIHRLCTFTQDRHRMLWICNLEHSSLQQYLYPMKCEMIFCHAMKSPISLKQYKIQVINWFDFIVHCPSIEWSLQNVRSFLCDFRYSKRNWQLPRIILIGTTGSTSKATTSIIYIQSNTNFHRHQILS